MTQEEIKLNHLIDLFYYGEEKGKHYIGLNDYSKHWELLMPVVEKIENLQREGSYLYSLEMGKDWCAITTNDFHPVAIVAESVVRDKIQSVWRAVVEFIKWYNQNN